MKKYYIAVLVVLVAVLIVSVAKKNNMTSIYFGATGDVCFTSIPEICSQPEKYDGKTVIVEGYLFAGYEIEGIYPEKKDVLGQTGICINLMHLANIHGESVPETINDKPTGKKVLVMGKYKLGETGHMNSCCGELISINSLSLF